jgi:hypothetical protein
MSTLWEDDGRSMRSSARSTCNSPRSCKRAHVVADEVFFSVSESDEEDDE